MLSLKRIHTNIILAVQLLYEEKIPARVVGSDPNCTKPMSSSSWPEQDYRMVQRSRSRDDATFKQRNLAT